MILMSCTINKSENSIYKKNVFAYVLYRITSDRVFRIKYNQKHYHKYNQQNNVDQCNEKENNGVLEKALDIAKDIYSCASAYVYSGQQGGSFLRILDSIKKGLLMVMCHDCPCHNNK